MTNPSKHIVIAAANAQGHLIPTIAFAKKLASHKPDFTITIATTPLNAQFIRSNIINGHDSSIITNIRTVDLPFKSVDHGLPPNIENTDSIPVPQIPLLVKAVVESTPPHFRALISSIIDEEKNPPCCVICDFLLGWGIEIAKSFNIPSYGLVIIGAFGTAACMSFWEHLPHRKSLDVDEYRLPGLPDEYVFKSSDLLPFIREADGNDDWSKFFRSNFNPALSSDGWVCNTVEEIEGLGLELLRKRTKLPIWPIGPLLPSTMLREKSSSNSTSKTHGQHGVKNYETSPNKCIEWLDQHPEESVIYISFGSQLTITTFQMMELAKGLEQSGHSFIWVIKPPLGFNKTETFRKEWLPENFEEKMEKSGQGFLVHGWAPQLEILSHKSTGAFLSHCGWNSVLESLSQGVPLVGWPMADDQKYNVAFLIEGLGVCVKLAGGLMSVIESKKVCETIDLVMDKSKGKREEMKKKLDEIASKMREAVKKDGSSIKALDDFINTFQT